MQDASTYSVFSVSQDSAEALIKWGKKKYSIFDCLLSH